MLHGVFAAAVRWSWVSENPVTKASPRVYRRPTRGTVGLSSVVPQTAVRELVVAAEQAAERGELVDAMIALVDAWSALVDPRPEPYVHRDPSPLQFGDRFRWHLNAHRIAGYLYNKDSGRRYPGVNDDIGQQFVAVTDVVEQLREAARLTVTGVGYARYLRFVALTRTESNS